MALPCRTLSRTLILAALIAFTGFPPAQAATVTVTNATQLQDALTTTASGDTILLSNSGDPSRPLNMTITSGFSGNVSGLTIDGTNISNRLGIISAGSGSTFPILDMRNASIAQIRNIELNGGRGGLNQGGAVTAAGILGGFSNVAFRQNEAQNSGGAVRIDGTFEGAITNNIHFDRNKANGGSGGGLYVDGSFHGSLDGTGGDVHFDGNTASSNGGGMYVGRDFGTTGSNSRIYANYFANNTAGTDGGGLYVGGNYIGDLAAYSFFDGNHAGGDGGGIYVGGVITGGIHGSPFTNNVAGGSGGGLHMNVLNGSIDAGSNFVGNTATGGSGGALMVTGIAVNPGEAALIGTINASFRQNTAGANGGAIAVGGIPRPRRSI